MTVAGTSSSQQPISWANGLQLPNFSGVAKNTSNSTITVVTTEIIPPNLLSMDPQSNTDIALDRSSAAPYGDYWAFSRHRYL